MDAYSCSSCGTRSAQDVLVAFPSDTAPLQNKWYQPIDNSGTVYRYVGGGQQSASVAPIINGTGMNTCLIACTNQI
jgi:hypothetical protein